MELTLPEKIGALRGDLAIPRERIVGAEVDPTPLRSIRGRLKVGLRVPGRVFVCHTGAWREFWAVRRGLPGLRVRLDDRGRMRELTVGTPDAARIAAALRGEGRGAAGR